MEWTENVIVVDADYVDSVAFDLIVNFERMLERRVPPADMARWLECVALDGGATPSEEAAFSVVLLHDKDRAGMDNFLPSDFAADYQGKAFSGPLGEFSFSVASTEAMVSKEQLLHDVLEMVCQQPTVKRLMVVPSANVLDSVRRLLLSGAVNKKADGNNEVGERQTTLFTMQPAVPSPFGRGGTGSQVGFATLGFSLLSSLGISADEIDSKLRSQDSSV